MKLFELSKEYKVACESQSTRSGFRHVAILLKNGCEVARTKVCYLNRTWEAYEYQTVLIDLVEGYFTDDNERELREDFLQVIKDRL